MLALAEAVATNQGTGKFLFGFHRVTQRIATRQSPKVAQSWLRAMARFQGGIDEKALRAAVAAKNVAQMEAAIGASRFGRALQDLAKPIAGTTGLAGTASTDVLQAHGINASFNAVHPNVVLFARDQAADLVVQVQDDVRAAIRTVVAIGAQQGLTVAEQARAIREIIPLPPNWQDAPFAFEAELRGLDASAATSRRLSAADKQRIRRRIKNNTVTDKFVDEMRDKYSRSLTHARAISIARTETIRAANHGQQESWMQAMDQGALPKNSRRFWIVTPDDRLSEEHAQIPMMNPDGRGMDEPFDTPDGFFMYPPSRPNCRCGIGLGVGVGGADASRGPPDFSALDDPAIMKQPSSAYPKVQEHDETLNRFQTASGQFTPERKALHDAIVRAHLEGVTPAESPQVMVLGGGPASGKSSAMRGIKLPNHVKVDVDHIRTLLPEYAEGVKVGNRAISTMTHEEASLLGKRITREAVRKRYNVLVDGTGDSSYENLAAKIQGYRAQGHRIVGRYVTVDTDTAIQRAFVRGEQTGRFVPDTYMREVHKSVSRVMPRAVRDGLFDELTLWDTNGAAAKEIMRAAGKQVSVLDELAWQRFLYKANEANPLIANAQLVLGAPDGVSPEMIRHYLGAYGQEWKAARLPSKYARGQPKNCYENATRLAMQNPELRYVEGVAYSAETGDLPFLHAWAVTPEGVVLDTTWANPAGARYFGIAYDSTDYFTYMAREKYYGVLGGNNARGVIRSGGIPKQPRRPPRGRVLQDQELDDMLGVQYEDLEDRLSDNSLRALFDYQAEDYSEINRYLRTRGLERPATPNEYVPRLVVAIDDAIADAPKFGRRGILYRGGRFDKALQVGDEFTDLGFISTSTDVRTAESFIWGKAKKDVGGQFSHPILRITTPGSQRGIWFPRLDTYGDFVDELEYLMMRGTRFKVTRTRTLSVEKYWDDFAASRYGSRGAAYRADRIKALKESFPDGITIVDVEALRVPRLPPRAGTLRGRALTKELDNNFKACPIAGSMAASIEYAGNGRVTYLDPVTNARKACVPPLTAAERKALNWYQSDGYRHINSFLRWRGRGKYRRPWGATFETEDLKESIRVLDKLLERMPRLRKSSVLWRGGELHPEMKVGKTFVDKGFVSTSARREVGEKFMRDAGADGVLFRIRAPRGQRGLWVPEAKKGVGDFFYEPGIKEAEFLLPRNLRYRVVRTQKFTRAEYAKEFGKAPRSLFDDKWVYRTHVQVVDLEVVPTEAARRAPVRRVKKKKAKKKKAATTRGGATEWKASEVKSLETTAKALKRKHNFEIDDFMSSGYGTDQMKDTASGLLRSFDDVAKQGFNTRRLKAEIWLEKMSEWSDRELYGAFSRLNPGTARAKAVLGFGNRRHKEWAKVVRAEGWSPARERQGLSGWWASDLTQQTFQHEIGHAFHWQSLGEPLFQKMRDNWNWVMSRTGHAADIELKMIARKVSTYAQDNPVEFVAETFTALIRGRRLPDDVLTLYKQLGGPISAKWRPRFRGIRAAQLKLRSPRKKRTKRRRG